VLCSPEGFQEGRIFFVYVLYRFYLLPEKPLVACLVRGFDVYVYKVVPFKGFQRILCLCGVVCVEVAGGAGDVDNLEAGVYRYSAEQVDC